MMRHRSLSLAIAIVIATPAQGADRVAQAVGRVSDATPAGAPTILRQDGHRDPARYPAIIYVEDHILIAPGRSLAVTINGQPRTLSAGVQPLDYRVEAPSRSISIWGGGILDSLRDFLSRPAAPVTGEVYSRGPGAPPPPPATADPLLPAGRQLLPRSTQAIAILWQGSAAGYDTIVDGKETDSSPTYDNSWAKFPIAAPPGNPFVLKLENSTVAWQIDFSDAPPLPPEMNPGAIGDGDRLARAVWLLRDGPKEWRLFAVSEIAAMADAKDFVAGELWRAATQGHLDSAILAR